MRRYVRPIQPKEAERRASSSLCRNPEDSKKVEHATTPAAKRRHRKARHVSAGKESGTKASPGGTAHWLRHRLGGARLSTIFLRVTFAHEIANRRVSGGQRFFVGEENDAEVFRPRTLAETGTVHDRHMLLANEFGDEDIVAFRDLDARVRVESPARRHTTHARSFGTPFHGQIAAAAQLAFHFEQVILRAFERGLDRVLLGMVGAKARA